MTWRQKWKKKSTFFGQKKYLFSKQLYESCVGDFLILFSVFVRQKVIINENVADHVSRILLPDCSKLVINWNNNNDVKIWHNVIVKFFWCCYVSLVKLSYWSKFRVNIITRSGVMTIFIYKSLIRNLEIGNTPVWVLLNIWRLGQVRDTKFGRNVSNDNLLNAANCQDYSFLPFLSY